MNDKPIEERMTTRMFQDAAGKIPVTGPGQSVGRIECVESGMVMVAPQGCEPICVVDDCLELVPHIGEGQTLVSQSLGLSEEALERLGEKNWLGGGEEVKILGYLLDVMREEEAFSFSPEEGAVPVMAVSQHQRLLDVERQAHNLLKTDTWALEQTLRAELDRLKTENETLRAAAEIGRSME